MMTFKIRVLLIKLLFVDWLFLMNTYFISIYY